MHKAEQFFPRKAARDHGLDLRRSFTVGDHPHDVHLARNAGATGVYVLTGHGAKHRDELDPASIVATDLQEAAGIILNRRNKP
ncbi:MAG: HAD hydrolase-like protein [Verrucomicrobiae bacterium]|nr:HAD hydrolase-like protein [Verrucomicrobiae bacterium]